METTWGTTKGKPVAGKPYIFSVCFCYCAGFVTTDQNEEGQSLLHCSP